MPSMFGTRAREVELDSIDSEVRGLRRTSGLSDTETEDLYDKDTELGSIDGIEGTDLEDNALAGPQFETRVGGLVFAVCALRHFLLATLMHWVVGGWLVVLPWTGRIAGAQAVGMGIYLWFGKSKSPAWRCWRGCLLGGSVCIDIVVSLALLVVVTLYLDSILREKSPSNPVNQYWGRWYWLMILASVFDFVVSFVPLLVVWRGFYLSRSAGCVPPPSSCIFPTCMTKAILPRRTLNPNEEALRFIRIALPLSGAALIASLALVAMGLGVGMGLFGTSRPGVVCSSMGMVTGASPTEACAETPATCDHLDPSECLLPFPSSFHMIRDSTMRTGWRVRITSNAMVPLNAGGDPFLNPDAWNERDGFSTFAPLLFRIGDRDGDIIKEVGGGGGVQEYLRGSTDAATSQTLLIDVEKGTLVPHFLEKDSALHEDPKGSLLILQPAVPLRNSARFVVGVRNLPSGSTLNGDNAQASGYFQRIRDKETKSMHELARQQDFDELVFPELEKFGWKREEMQLAWDFRTVSWESSTGRAQHIVRESVRRLESGEAPSSYMIEDIVPEQCNGGKLKGREVWGSVRGPSYTVFPGPGAELLRVLHGGVPIPNGEVDVRFVSIIPCSALAQKKASQIVQFGHGLLLTKHEAVESGWLRVHAEDTASVVLAVDWVGMSAFDFPIVARILLSDLAAFKIVPDQLQQSFANGASAVWYMRNRLRSDAAFAGKDGSPVLSADTPVTFYGMSQGGVLGGGYVLSSPFIEKAVLGVPGTPFALLVSRSIEFLNSYLKILQIQVLRPTHIRIAITLLQQLWDVGESAGWLSEWWDESKGIGPKRFLLQSGLGDALVPSLGAEVMGRALNCTLLSPKTRPVYGLAEKEGPLTEGSALVEFGFIGAPPEPKANIPPPLSINVHDLVRRSVPGMLQVKRFLLDGVIEQTCPGPQGCTDLPRPGRLPKEDLVF